MANQEQNPPQQEQHFVAAKQVGFDLEDIILNTNNEVSLLYLEHNNKDYFKCVSDFILETAVIKRHLNIEERGLKCYFQQTPFVDHQIKIP
ncbi:hypothetical protein Tco_0977053 [Tanacetum coccineum]|uniref:Uncharacterized protein n=1 Tax=Tanacetum coccineum TaxID=301880 RepID=A0ABQ5EJ27_9ASTR